MIAFSYVLNDWRFWALSKGVVASYQAALSEEYTPLEGAYPVLT